MTDKEVKNLTRTDLLKILLEAEEENIYLRAQVEGLKRELEKKTLILANIGSLAGDSLNMNDVYKQAMLQAQELLRDVKERSTENEQGNISENKADT